MTAVTEHTPRFCRDLLAAARPRPISENPFILSLTKGEVSREQLCRYAVKLAGIAAGFPQVLSSLLAVCDDPRVRQHLIANLLEEEGVSSCSEKQFRVDPARSHGFLAARFARAAGADNTTYPPPPSPWFEKRVRAGSWIGPFAYSAVGHEANVPPTFKLIIKALSTKYGFDQESLEFLTEHVTADERHGQEAAEMIAAIVQSAADRAEAIEGARRGGLAWWGFHKAFANHPPE